MIVTEQKSAQSVERSSQLTMATNLRGFSALRSASGNM